MIRRTRCVSCARAETSLVLRTFSKIQGLASLRIGYGIARPELIQVLQKTRQPFNVNGLAQAAALAALEDDEHLRETKRITDEGRAYLQERIRGDESRVRPERGEFRSGESGRWRQRFSDSCSQRQIIVRALKGYNLPEWIRISVGTMEQNRRCIAALREVLKQPR